MTCLTAFTSGLELQSVVNACLKKSGFGSCSTDMWGNMKYGPVSYSRVARWDVSRVNYMKGIFKDFNGFNSDISKWKVSGATDMSYMFANAQSFAGDISKWDVSKVTNMKSMFVSAYSFNSDISKWDVSKVIDVSYMFKETNSFDGDISKWDVSSVTDMRNMFNDAKLFNSDISKWDVSKVTDMSVMFMGAKSFNRELCGEAWVNSKTGETSMFDGSSGSISTTLCGLWSSLIVIFLFLRNPVSSSPQHHIMSNLHLSFFSYPLSSCSRLATRLILSRPCFVHTTTRALTS